MSNVSYDLDTSGGLMPLIRALIKPPDEEANGQKAKKPQHPYYKRPGKGHNHDSCDACGEGGDLICCDRCPASFHLVCYDPPLDENDIPAGLWLCKECRGSDAEAEKEASSRSSRAQSPADEPRSLRNKKSKDVKDEDKLKEEKEKEIEKEKEELTPMEILVKAAKIMNPRQFELPRQMRVPCPFPGTDKEGTKNGTTALVTVESSGCVPLPAKTCFVCSGTCKAAPLLQCDYCPLLFHQDCLDPPLTALPTGRWMCPNHVEQYIDWKLVNSVSATERVALWDQFSGPVDQHAIKIDFIRRARKFSPSFRIKVPAGVRGRVVVPAMVRHHYQHPPPLLPSRREYVRCKNVLKNQQTYATEMSEEEETPKHTICMNLECAQYQGQGQGQGQCPHSEETLRGAALQASAETRVDIGSESDSLSDSDFEYLTSPVKRRKMADKPPSGRNTRLTLSGHDDASALLAAVDEQLEKLDDRLVKLLAWQRLQQVLVGEQCAGPWRRTPLSSQAERLVQRSIDRHQLAKYGFNHVALPSELLTRGERESISRAVWGAASSLSPPPPASPGHSLSDAVVKATVCAVLRPARNGLGDGLGRPIPMRLSRLTVGSDSGCDVVLQHNKCRHVAPRHATIFYDEVRTHMFTHRNGLGDGLGRPIPMRLSRLTVGSDSGCDVVLQHNKCRHVAPRHATIFYDEVRTHMFTHRNGLGDGLGRPIPMRLSRLTVGSDSGCDVVLQHNKCRHVAPRHATIFYDEVRTHMFTHRNGLGDGLGRPIPMRLSRLTVGSDSGCDVVLQHNKCRHVAPRHATIFYDEVRTHMFTHRNGLGDGLGRPIPMRLSRLTVGSDSGCDVVLQHNKCRHVAPRHATIFYDEVTQHFELINYSEWGSAVNGVLYTCDCELAAPRAEPCAPSGAPGAPGAAADATALIRDIVDKHPAPRLSGSLAADRAPPEHPCSCRGPPPARGAWEGSALVPHGALLQFGCLMYVFSITDALASPSEQPGRAPRVEQAEQAPSEVL